MSGGGASWLCLQFAENYRNLLYNLQSTTANFILFSGNTSVAFDLPAASVSHRISAVFKVNHFLSPSTNCRVAICEHFISIMTANGLQQKDFKFMFSLHDSPLPAIVCYAMCVRVCVYKGSHNYRSVCARVRVRVVIKMHLRLISRYFASFNEAWGVCIDE